MDKQQIIDKFTQQSSSFEQVYMVGVNKLPNTDELSVTEACYASGDTLVAIVSKLLKEDAQLRADVLENVYTKFTKYEKHPPSDDAKQAALREAFSMLERSPDEFLVVTQLNGTGALSLQGSGLFIKRAVDLLLGRFSFLREYIAKKVMKDAVVKN